MSEHLTSVAAALAARGFEPHVFATAAEAKTYLLGEIEKNAPVAVGGSMTIKDLGLADTLREQGHEVFWHWEAAPSDRPGVLLKALHADYYLASANAITESGVIVQIDGTGNRVGAMIAGPKEVIVVAGANKLVDGNIAQAIARIKTVACPQNARRLGLNTPCGLQGKCDAAHCEKGMCNVTSIIERPVGGHKITIVLVDEEAGY